MNTTTKFPFRFPLSRRVFRDDNLVSAGYALLFGFSCAFTIIFTFLMKYSVEPSAYSDWRKILFALSYTFAPFIVAFLYIGMWFYWSNVDSSPKGLKRLWFFVLLFGLWYGGILYFLGVYLPSFRRSSRGQF